MLKETLRKDTKDLFRLQLYAYAKWEHTPVVVLDLNDEPVIIRERDELLSLAYAYPDLTCLCGWPGKWRQDLFLFTIGEFLAAQPETFYG